MCGSERNPLSITGLGQKLLRGKMREDRTPTQNRSRRSNNLLPRRTSPRLKRPQDPNENFDEEDDEEPGESQPLLSPAPFNDVVIPADHDRVVESQLTIDGLHS